MVTSDSRWMGQGDSVNDHGVISGELWREAEAHGVATSYRDWHGRRAEVGEETLRAVLAAMGGAPRRNAGAPAAPLPSGRTWGFTIQLYSLRSRRSWGHGDLRDLASSPPGAPASSARA